MSGDEVEASELLALRDGGNWLDSVVSDHGLMSRSVKNSRQSLSLRTEFQWLKVKWGIKSWESK